MSGMILLCGICLNRCLENEDVLKNMEINDFHGEVKLGKYEAKFKISRRNLQLIDGLIELEQGKVLSII